MEIENSSLFNEVELITNSGAKPVSFYWTAKVHFNDSSIDVLKVLTINTLRDYEKNIGDEISLEVAVPLGVYAKQIYPNRNNLEVTLFRKPLDEIADQAQNDTEVDSERFKAILVIEGLPVLEGTEMGQQSEGALDLMNILTLSFQLVNKSLHELRIVTVGGIFRNSKAEDVIKAVLAKESSKITINGESSILGVDIVEGNNKIKRNHTVIPQGTKLLNLPTYIQEKCGGVYSTAIGSYLQNKVWYVYPLYDTTKLLTAEKTVTLIKVPKNRFTGIERTYRQEGGSIFILGTSETKFKDDANTEFMNQGNGVRIADANQFMGSVASTKGNKTSVSRGKLNSEFISKASEDGKNNVQTSSNPISANPFVEYSKLASRNGGIFSFVWENANSSLLFPGMKTKVLYLDGEDIIELHGVLLSQQILNQLSGKGFDSNRHLSTVKLHVFVNKVKDT